MIDNFGGVVAVYIVALSEEQPPIKAQSSSRALLILNQE